MIISESLNDHIFRNLDFNQAATHTGNKENSVYLLDETRLYYLSPRDDIDGHPSITR